MTLSGPTLENAHLTGLETLPTQEIEKILAVAGKGAHWLEEDAPKTDTLRGRVIMLGFLEPSTRTRVSFEIAGKRLGADTINLSSGGSSLEKGETLLDTVLTLESMGVACLVLRHPGSRAPCSQHTVAHGAGTMPDPVRGYTDRVATFQPTRGHGAHVVMVLCADRRRRSTG